MSIRDRLWRWKYRRMAWKDDPHLFFDMHPHLSKLVDEFYRRSWPFRNWLWDWTQSAVKHQKFKAIQATFGTSTWEDLHNFDGDAKDVYAHARSLGWTPERKWSR